MDKVPAVIGLQREPNSPRSIKLPRSRMDSWRIKGRRLLAGGVSDTISKRVSWLFWGILGIASVLLVSVAMIAGSSATGSNGDKAPRGQADREVPPGMAWIPGGAFLMGTNDKESFPNERPAHLVHVRSVGSETSPAK